MIEPITSASTYFTARQSSHCRIELARRDLSSLDSPHADGPVCMVTRSGQRSPGSLPTGPLDRN